MIRAEGRLKRADGDGRIGWNEVVRSKRRVTVEAVGGNSLMEEFLMVRCDEEVIGWEALKGQKREG